jgi:ubiquinone/menaquinone biosynthesis C-methylase UbiE
MAKDEYVLRPLDQNEISRLGHQHEVWRHDTDRVVAAAGFKAEDRLLDLGCGPGFLTRDLAERVGSRGSVLAVDTSEGFIAHLEAEVREHGLEQVRAEVADARELDLPAESLDGAICRWLLMFVSEPERVVGSIWRVLRPGGALAVMEYTQFRSTSLWPEGRCFRRLYEKVHELIAAAGGDADIGARVPSLAAAAGFEIERLIPIWRVGRPGSPEWEWLERTHPNHPNLVEAGLVTTAELEAYYREWERNSRNPAAVFTAPPVLATIARKR